MARIQNIVLLSALFLLLTACPGSSHKNDIKKLQENGMDFPDPRNESFRGVDFRISDMFVNDYSDSYVIQDNALTMVVYAIDVNFSIEEFTEDEAEVFQFSFEEEINALDAVHDHYVIRRARTLDNPTISIKKELPKTVKYPGYIQTIHGSSDEDYNFDSSYFTATLEIDGNFYVVQMIGKRSNMGYLYDDFIDILNSIHT